MASKTGKKKPKKASGKRITFYARDKSGKRKKISFIAKKKR